MIDNGRVEQSPTPTVGILSVHTNPYLKSTNDEASKRWIAACKFFIAKYIVKGKVEYLIDLCYYKMEILKELN